MNIPSISTSPTLQNNPEASIVPRAATSIAPTPPAQPISQEQVQAAANSVREYIQPFNGKLEFSVNKDIHRVVVKVVDSESGEVIRQIPSEEMIAIAKALDSIKGLLFNQKA